jgi:hypothetical protein
MEDIETAWSAGYKEFSQEDPNYTIPTAMFWSTVFIDYSILKIPDPQNQTHIQYWANTDGGLMDVHDVLIKVIKHGIRFRITVPSSAMRHFRPLNTSTQVLAAEAFYAEDFVETPLVWERGGTGFLAQWQHHVMDILN